MTDDDRSTHFGYQEVPWRDKQRRVKGVFDSVADNYDLMNDLMSAGLHRVWKRFTLERCGLRPGQRALDVAGGSGDLARGLARRAGPKGQVILSDINERMLVRGRARIVDAGLVGNMAFVIANAQTLPFRSASFHCVTIGFGLRNVTDKQAAVADMYRVLKPGGRLLVLEFSKPTQPLLAPLYDLYSFKVLPRLGQAVTADGESYRYLAESIRMHPDQDTLKNLILDCGFDDCSYHNLSGGIVALHVALKY
jgi:demethylmenaquinone methyltransferase/2-methoxy-6-polyprenyl-1,4-benzoquinol methylase